MRARDSFHVLTWWVLVGHRNASYEWKLWADVRTMIVLGYRNRSGFQGFASANFTRLSKNGGDGELCGKEEASSERIRPLPSCVGGDTDSLGKNVYLLAIPARYATVKTLAGAIPDPNELKAVPGVVTIVWILVGRAPRASAVGAPAWYDLGHGRDVLGPLRPAARHTYCTRFLLVFGGAGLAGESSLIPLIAAATSA